ncbi:MAG TPA: phytanoyl-CoA dioxygenase family protein [Chitinophagaceae bacterium]|nr:phytanoyl-CoA dioxygenase family protein [Chitinophagaceae bacterium]
MNAIQFSSSSEKSSIGVMHLKRYWEKSLAKRDGSIPQQAFQEEWNLDFTLLNTLGLGLEQTIQYLYQQKPDLDEFEKWILNINGGSIPETKIENFNSLVEGHSIDKVRVEEIPNALSDTDIEFWNSNGYVIIRQAISKEDAQNTIDIICDFLGIDLFDRSTWYRPHPARQGIMIQLFQSDQLEKNRRSQKIKAAYEQLWNRKDLWCSTDRVSFNPPENENWTFPGPRLHWDVSLELPIPFGLQGLLYLSDTQEDQGAFTLVPGFHNRIQTWINSLPPGTNPRTEDLYALGAKPIGANAGDFILWHQALPHGSSPNTAAVPRFVQYINYMPVDAGVKEKWK